MPTRALARTNAPRGYAIPSNAPIRVDSTTSAVKVIPAGTGSTEVELVQSVTTGATGALKIAFGSQNLVSGAATVATGLNSVSSFIGIMKEPATGSFTTGATEVDRVVVTSITTGSVVVAGVFNSFVTGAATISASGTGLFYWQAMGT